MTSPLQASSEAYARAAEQVDDVMSAHADAMVAWNVQELIELGLGLFASYDRLDSRWREGRAVIFPKALPSSARTFSCHAMNVR